MVDREEVILGLEHCSEDGCKGCPYEPDCTMCDGFSVLAKDALELLKEQEPVKPIRLENWWKCPSCSGNIVANMNYCPRCGRVVNWDEGTDH